MYDIAARVLDVEIQLSVRIGKDATDERVTQQRDKYVTEEHAVPALPSLERERKHRVKKRNGDPANRLVHGIYDREIHLPLLLSCHAVGVQLIRNEAMKIRIQNPLLRLDLVAGGERLELLQRVPPGNDQVTQRMTDDTFADDVFRLALSSDKAV